MDHYIVSFRNGRRRSPPYVSTPSRLVSRRATLDIGERLSKFSAERYQEGTRVNCSDRDRKTSRDNRPNRKEGRIREGAGRASIVRLWPARYGASAIVLASAPQSGWSERARLDLIATRARGWEHGERSRPRLHLAAASAK